MEGRLVELNASSFRTPPICCSCGAPQQLQLKNSMRKGRAGGGSTTLSMDFPYCMPCSERVKQFKAKQVLTVVIAVAAGLLVGGLVFAIPALSIVVSAVLALVIGGGASVGAVLGMSPPQPPAPATARGEAARIVAFSGMMTKVYCSSSQWGDEFARANNVQAQPKSKGDGYGIGAIVTGFIIAPLAAAGAWFGAHPTLYVDNPTKDSINVYVDGKKVMTVAGDTHDSMNLGYGKHVLGWSKSDATAPVGTVEAQVKISDAHLYNPNKTGCYWLVADAYGSASVNGMQQGPQQLQEFYAFDKVDTWFGENPQSIEVQSGSSGGTKVALQRAKACMELSQHGCSAEIRNQLLSCEKTAKDEAAFDNCTKQAVALCGGAPSGATQPAHAAPAHPAAPGPAKPAPAPAAAPKKK